MRKPRSVSKPPTLHECAVVGELELNGCCYVIVNQPAGPPPTGGRTILIPEDLAPAQEMILSGEVCSIFRQEELHAPNTGDPTDVLSPRELQIVCQIAAGHPNKIVADRLGISEWTVATYLRRIFCKLGVDTRAAMVFRCRRVLEVSPPTRQSSPRTAGTR